LLLSELLYRYKSWDYSVGGMPVQEGSPWSSPY